MSRDGRIVWIDQLRSIAFFFVILGHVALPDEMQSVIYSFHMPLFFLISGLTINREKIASVSLWKYAAKLAKALLIPYVWMSLLCYPLWYLAFHMLDVPVEDTPINAAVGILAGNNLIEDSTSNALWFLLVLFIAELLFAVFIKLTRNNSIAIACLVIVCAVAGCLDSGVPRIWHCNVALTAVVFLFLGNCFMKWYRSSKLMHSKRNFAYVIKIVTAEVFFITVGTISHIFNERISMTANKFGNSPYLFYVTSVAFSLAVMFAVIHMPRIKAVEYIGQNTLLYVGIHIPILRIFERAFPDIFLNFGFSIPFAFVLYFGIIPIVVLFKKYFPYVCGKTSDIHSLPVFIGKFILVLWSAFIPYGSIVSNSGINFSNPLYTVLSAVAFVAVSVVFVLATTRFVPVIYLQSRDSQNKRKISKISTAI